MGGNTIGGRMIHVERARRGGVIVGYEVMHSFLFRVEAETRLQLIGFRVSDVYLYILDRTSARPDCCRTLRAIPSPS